MKLIVGLGNPGRKYDKTRHNVGYDVLAELSRRHAVGSPRNKFEGEICEALIGDQQSMLLWPHTYMNASGRSVRAALDFFQLACEDVLILSDDFQLPLARIRLRPSGSAGGQKGLADVIRALATDQVSRLRVGVGPLPERSDPTEFVLRRFSRTERPAIDEALNRAADAVAVWAQHGIGDAMNQYN